MTFENKLNKVVKEYQKKITNFISFMNEEGSNLENRMLARNSINHIFRELLKVDKVVFTEESESPLNSIIIDYVNLPFPNGYNLFYKVKDEDAPKEKRYEGVRLYLEYNQEIITSVNLKFSPGLCPRIMKPKKDGLVESEFWLTKDRIKGWNETGYGTIKVDFGNMNGFFVPKKREPIIGESCIQVSLGDSSKRHDYIRIITIPTIGKFGDIHNLGLLGKGDLTNFFKHVNYAGLEKLFSEKHSK